MNPKKRKKEGKHTIFSTVVRIGDIGQNRCNWGRRIGRSRRGRDTSCLHVILSLGNGIAFNIGTRWTTRCDERIVDLLMAEIEHGRVMAAI